MVLFSAGLHVPVMPFKDVAGSNANGSPAQIGFMESNIGATIEFTTMVSV